MAEKQKRTEIELNEIIKQEIRKHPAFRGIISGNIERLGEQVPHQPNWRIFWLMDGAGSVPPIALEIERKLQNQFELD